MVRSIELQYRARRAVVAAVTRAPASLSLAISTVPAPALACLVLAMSPPVIAALYLAKSALGINLMPGPSPLHDLLYHLVR